MEDKKNYPSLPSNYVTLAHLQQRWLKQQEMNHNDNQLPQQQQQDPMQNLQQQDPHQRGDRAVVVPRHGTASRSSAGNHCAKQYRSKIPNDSGSNRRAIEVTSENHRKSEANAGIGDENADNESKDTKKKKKKKKKNKVKRKPRVDKEERGANEVAAHGTIEGNKKAVKSEDDEKTTTRSEKLNDKSGNSIVEVEEKFGVLSMNAGNGKRNGRLRTVPSGFDHSQSLRSYGHGHFGGGFRRQRQQVQKCRGGDNMVWVRKDGNVGGIETSSRSYN